MNLSEQQSDRYSRHLTLPQIGAEGQQKLLQSHVLIVGMGGLGSPVALYLAAAGIGRLTLVDFDIVERSNLQRQIAHTTERIGMLKTHSAKAACHAINPDIQIDTVDVVLEQSDLSALLETVDLVVEGSDNFATRHAVNAACVDARIPLVSGAAIRMEGQASVFRNDKQASPCYHCLYGGIDTDADTCAMTGVLGPVVGFIGCIQAIETIKVLCDIGTTLESRLILFDAISMEWNEVKLNKNPQCPVCS